MTVTKRVSGAITETTSKRVSGAITETTGKRVSGAITETSTQRVSVPGSLDTIYDAWGGSWGPITTFCTWGEAWVVHVSATELGHSQRVSGLVSENTTKRVLGI